LPRPLDPELWNDPRAQALCDALRAVSTEDQILKRFLQDLWTSGELWDFAKRWTAAIAVHREGQTTAGAKKRSQAQIAHELGISTTVVNHAAKLVRGPEGTGGFVEAFRLLEAKAGEPRRRAGEEPS
jgi:uncharacterized protein YerC